MSVDFTCGDGGALAAYLYGEGDAAERSVIQAHLSICAACAAELALLGVTRSALASWTPPETALGFQVVSARETATPATVLRPPRWWQRPMPAWAQAAAALLIFAMGGVFGMRAGVGDRTPASAPVVTSATGATPLTTVSTADLAALERRLRREMMQLRTSAPAVASESMQPARVSASDEQLVDRFRAMLADSEERQRRELALRLTQLVRDFDAQRRFDFARIEQTFGQMEGMTGPELRQQRQAIDYLIRTAVQRPQQ
jgi:anti-sigma factor RsiW